ncbi:hypothetical protein D3C87_1412230 [compost metagenome]
MALPSGFTAQTQLQRQTGQSIAGDGLQVMQTRCQGADAVVARGAKDKTAQRIVIANHHVQPAVRLAGIALRQ